MIAQLQPQGGWFGGQPVAATATPANPGTALTHTFGVTTADLSGYSERSLTVVQPTCLGSPWSPGGNPIEENLCGGSRREASWTGKGVRVMGYDM
jgi:hypothetical protein